MSNVTDVVVAEDNQSSNTAMHDPQRLRDCVEQLAMSAPTRYARQSP